MTIDSTNQQTSFVNFVTAGAGVLGAVGAAGYLSRLPGINVISPSCLGGALAGGLVLGLGVRIGAGYLYEPMRNACTSARQFWNKITPFFKQTEANTPEVIPKESAKNMASSILMQLESAKNDDERKIIYSEADRLKESTFKNLQNQARTVSDILNYCDIVDRLHGKPERHQEVESLIDCYYPESRDADINHDLKNSVRLSSLGEKDNPSAVMNFKGPFNKYPDQELAQKAKRGVDAMNHAASSLESLKCLDVNVKRKYADAIKNENAIGRKAVLLRTLSALDAPRPWRKSAYWNAGRLLTANDAGYVKPGQPKPVQVMVELIRECERYGANSKDDLDQLLITFIKQKGGNPSVWEPVINAFSDDEIRGDTDDNKVSPITTFANSSELRSYLMGLIKKAYSEPN